MKISLFAVSVVLSAAVAATACFAGGASSQSASHAQAQEPATPGTPESPATSATQPHKITIGNFTFSPATLEVPAGTTLQWSNEDDVPHTIVGSDAGSPLKSPALDTEDRYSVVLDHPGVYHYFCSLHPHMTGTVIVK